MYISCIQITDHGIVPPSICDFWIYACINLHVGIYSVQYNIYTYIIE